MPFKGLVQKVKECRINGVKVFEGYLFVTPGVRENGIDRNMSGECLQFERSRVEEPHLGGVVIVNFQSAGLEDMGLDSWMMKGMNWGNELRYVALPGSRALSDVFEWLTTLRQVGMGNGWMKRNS